MLFRAGDYIKELKKNHGLDFSYGGFGSIITTIKIA